MKQTFRSFYNVDDWSEKLNKNDANIIIVLDAYVLCNLYGLEETERDEALKYIGKIKHLLWLPYNISLTYHHAIISSIKMKCNALLWLKKRIGQLQIEMKQMPIPYIQRKELDGCAKKLQNSLTKRLAYLKKQVESENVLREKIADLYKDRVGGTENDPDPESFLIQSYESESNDVFSTDSIFDVNGMGCSASNSKEWNDVILHTLIKLSKKKECDILYVISKESSYWMTILGKTKYGLSPKHGMYFNKETFGHNLQVWTFEALIKAISKEKKMKLSDELSRMLRVYDYGSSKEDI